MTDKEKIRAEIKRLRKHFQLEYQKLEIDDKISLLMCGKRNLCDDLISYIDSLPKESVSEDLETEIDNISEKYRGLESLCEHDVIEICEHFFKFGAQWQRQQMVAKAFDFTKEHNTACVLASECLRNHGWFNRERVFNDLFRHLSCVDKLFEGKFSGKTKVIVIKEG